MPRYLLTIDYNGGVTDTPMEEWKPNDVKAHMDYYGALIRELNDSGEMVTNETLTGPETAKVVTFDGVTAPVVTDGPFTGFTEMLAGYQVVEVDSLERAVEIAARLSCVPGPGGVALQQPVGIRRVMDSADFEKLRPEL